MKKILIQVKGITLIALVVTIIVLLILAGVALNLTIGQNVIFQKAQEAANTWRNAEKNEQLAMEEGADLIDSYLYNTATTVVDAKNQNKFFKKDTTIKDDLQNKVRIPKGFKIAEDSGTKVEDGVVIEDRDGNQFVWIPAKTGNGVTINTTKGEKTIVYKRSAYSTNVATGEIDTETNSEKIKNLSSSIYYYTEELAADEEESLNINGGYYIGRYEAGDKESTEVKAMRTSESLQSNTVTIRKDQVPYNYISKAQAIILSEEMSSIQGYTAKTKLVSSYAWDTAISFMQITNEDYGNSSIEGNYRDTAFTYSDIEGKGQIKDNGENLLVPTGETTAVCNIYDMGGNLWEITSEEFSNNEGPCAYRGGFCIFSYATYPAGYRNNDLGNAYGNLGFRITLFLQN